MSGMGHDGHVVFRRNRRIAANRGMGIVGQDRDIGAGRNACSAADGDGSGNAEFMEVAAGSDDD